jgi:hypothetical protein
MGWRLEESSGKHLISALVERRRESVISHPVHARCLRRDDLHYCAVQNSPVKIPSWNRHFEICSVSLDAGIEISDDGLVG